MSSTLVPFQTIRSSVSCLQSLVLVSAFAVNAIQGSLVFGAPDLLLESVTPARQRVHEMITLRGTGFGTFTPGQTAVFFVGADKTRKPMLFDAGLPYVWRDDFIQIRVPVGIRSEGVSMPIPKEPLLVYVVADTGTTNTQPFQVITRNNSKLVFEQRTMIQQNRDVSGFLGTLDDNIMRTKDAEIGDVNGDGWPDLIDNNSNNLANRSHAVLRINQGGRNFTSMLWEPSCDKDVGTFPVTVLPGGVYTDNSIIYDADLADLNNDELPDWIQAAAGTGTHVRIAINNYMGIPGNFIESTSTWTNSSDLFGLPDDICHGDINYDGFVDIAAALRSTRSCFVYINNGGTTFHDPLNLVSAVSFASQHDVFMIDVDHDGFKDIIGVNQSGAAQAFLNNGANSPTFTPGPTFASSGNFAGTAADFNGDGLDDFVLGRSQAVVYFNDPNNAGSFTTFVLPSGTSSMYDFEAGDIDLDGDIDIVSAIISSGANNVVRIWTNNGDGTFDNAAPGGATTLLPGLGNYQRMSADLIDFDLDGDLDLYLTGNDGQDVGPAVGSPPCPSTGPFGRGPNQFFESLVIDVLLGDINLDGFVNLLDVAPFVALVSSGDFQAEADTNFDGLLNLLDVGPFVELLGGN